MFNRKMSLCNITPKVLNEKLCKICENRFCFKSVGFRGILRKLFQVHAEKKYSKKIQKIGTLKPPFSIFGLKFIKNYERFKYSTFGFVCSIGKFIRITLPGFRNKALFFLLPLLWENKNRLKCTKKYKKSQKNYFVFCDK